MTLLTIIYAKTLEPKASHLHAKVVMRKNNTLTRTSVPYIVVTVD